MYQHNQPQWNPTWGAPPPKKKRKLVPILVGTNLVTLIALAGSCGGHHTAAPARQDAAQAAATTTTSNHYRATDTATMADGTTVMLAGARQTTVYGQPVTTIKVRFVAGPNGHKAGGPFTVELAPHDGPQIPAEMHLQENISEYLDKNIPPGVTVSPEFGFNTTIQTLTNATLTVETVTFTGDLTKGK